MLFFFLFIILYFLVAWHRLKLALFLIIVLLPTYQLRFQMFGLPTTFLEVMIIILFAVYLLRNYENFKKVRKSFKNWFWLILAWLITGLIAVFVSPDKWLALGHWRAYFLEPILFLIVLLDVIKRDVSSAGTSSFTALDMILFGLSISALYISLWAIYQKITGQGMVSLEIWQYPLITINRATGPFPHSNFLGLFLGPLILLFVGQLIINLKSGILNVKRLLVVTYWLSIIVLSVLAIIFAKSEGAILGIVFGLFIFFFLYLGRRQRLVFVISLLLIVVYLLLLSSWREAIWQKITFQDLSLKMRLNIWQGAWQMVRSNPFWGIGLRGYQQLVNQYQRPFYLPGIESVISNEFHPYPHNLFLTLWLELGIFGLIVFSLIVLQFFKLGFQKLFRNSTLEIRNLEQINHSRILIIAVMASMLEILVHGLVDTPYFKNDLAVLFWLIVGLILVKSYYLKENGLK